MQDHEVMTVPTTDFDTFLKVHMAAGRVVEVQEFPRARRPTYKVRVDFGPEIGERWSSVQAKTEYAPEELNGKIVIGVVNLPVKDIGGFKSEVLILGVPAEDGSLSLLEAGRGARLGGRVY